MNTKKLIDILEDHDLSVVLAENETELVVACPLCYSEDRKLYIAADTGAWICFKCDEHGGLRALLRDVCEMPSNEAYPIEMALLAGKKQVPGLIVSRPAPASTVNLPKGFIPLDDTLSAYGTSAAEYLDSRGVNLDRATSLGMGFCLTGYYKHRIITPVITQGKLRTYVARSWLEDVKKKVLMPAGSQAERALFGYDGLDGVNLVNWTDLILVEGVFDAIRMWNAGYRETVATLGAHVTELQRNLVKRLQPRHVVLLRDLDDAGRDAAIKEAKGLSEAMLSVKIAHLSSSHDPGVADSGEIRRALDSARLVDQHLGIEALKEVHNND